MNFSTNLAHWVCVLAGIYLVITSLVLRDVLSDRPPDIGLPASQHSHARHTAYSIGSRAIMIAVGLAAVAYGISRML